MNTRSTVSRRAGLAGLVGGALASMVPGGMALAQTRRLKALSTIGMVGDLVREIGGDRIAAETLLGEGVDPHLYKPNRADLAKLLGAEIVFYNGLLLEGKMVDALIRVARTGKPVHAVTEALPEDALIEPEGADGHADPHVWMDVRLWARAAEAIADALAKADAAGAATYRTNLATLQARLSELDSYAERVIASIPEQSRVLVTAHDAFHYFARRYRIDVMGIQGLSTESEAGLARINELVDLLVTRRIGAVFAETSVSDRNLRAVIEGAAARGHTVRIGGSLFSDAMGAPGTYEGTYIGMMDHNATVVARSLGGTAPERGLHGRLSLA